MKTLLKGLAVLVVVGVLLAAAVGAVVWSKTQSFLAERPSSAHEERIVTIPRGAGPKSVAALLASEGVVTNAEHFALFLRYREAAPRLRAGEFRFWTDQTPDEVLDLLLNAAEVTYPVTFPEGLRIEEMAARVEAAGLGSAARYVELARDPKFIATLDLPLEPLPPHLEGILTPETYSLRAGSDAEDVVRAQVKRFKEIWDQRRLDRARELDMTPYEVVVLASVVEKETGQAHERPLIGGVFHNRLRIGMMLQSDPTIIYGLKDYDGDIRRKDIRDPHPWNTYVHGGLPPTPIAAPGQAAIDGVLWPEETKALYFVSKNDGTHYFSKTLAEHNRAVNKYQRRR